MSSGASHAARIPVPTTRRDVIHIGPVRSVRADPFGLLRRDVSWTQPALLYVHPVTTPLDEFGSGLLRDLEGQPSSEISPSDVAFHALRQYEPGDDRRYIHWRTSARTGRLMIRQFVDTRRSLLAVVVGGRSAEYEAPEHFELAISAAASIAVRGTMDGQDVSLGACGRILPSSARNGLLDGLSGVKLVERGRGLRETGLLMARSVPEASIVVLVTGSVPGVGELRGIAQRFAASVRVLVVQVGSREPSIHRAGPLQIVTIRELSDLQAGMRASGL
ncbi:MAG: DUF58 domain-containing protein [Acidimicrobiales bacterium]